jgi:hypothetical protein
MRLPLQILGTTLQQSQYVLRRIYQRRVRGASLARCLFLARPRRKDRRKPSGPLGPAALPAEQDAGASTADRLPPRGEETGSGSGPMVHSNRA